MIEIRESIDVEYIKETVTAILQKRKQLVAIIDQMEGGEDDDENSRIVSTNSFRIAIIEGERNAGYELTIGRGEGKKGGTVLFDKDFKIIHAQIYDRLSGRLAALDESIIYQILNLMIEDDAEISLTSSEPPEALCGNEEIFGSSEDDFGNAVET
jgi:hypothetical protein